MSTRSYPAPSLRSLLPLGLAGLLGACQGPLEVTIQLVDPCNRNVVETLEWLRFEPRGTGIDSEGLGTVVERATNAAPKIELPRVADFKLVVTGHDEEYPSPPAAIGVSGVFDLVNAEGPVAVNVPIARIDQFYRVTDLAKPGDCASLNVPRYGATATYLPGSGKVLIVGGARLEDGALEYVSTVELFEPESGRFQVIELESAGALERAFHTATLLPDDQVLIAGGQAWLTEGDQVHAAALRSAVLIDARNPASIALGDTITMRQARTGHAAAILSDGQVVFAGGRVLDPNASREEDHTYLASIEVYDPARGLFFVPDTDGGAALELSAGRYGHSLTGLGTDDLVVAGGYNRDGPVRNLDLLRRPEGGKLLVQTSTLTSRVGPIHHSAALDADGRVLLSGGYGAIADAILSGGLPKNPSSNAEAWKLDEAGVLRRVCSAVLPEGRGYHTTLVVGRRALLAGGRGADGLPLANAEVATLATSGQSCFSTRPERVEMAEARSEHAAALLGSGEIAIIGGRQHGGPTDLLGFSIGGAEVFSPARVP